VTRRPQVVLQDDGKVVAEQDVQRRRRLYRGGMSIDRSLARRLRELDPVVADGLLAAALALLAFSQLLIQNSIYLKLGLEFRSPNLLAGLVVLAQTAPLAWRRRSPLLVLAVMTAAELTNLLLRFPPTLAELGLYVGLYTVAAYQSPRSSRLAAAAFALYGVFYGVIYARWYDGITWQDWVISFAMLAAAWWLGELQRRRRLTTVHLERLNAQLQRERDLKARWAVAEERARIARELHDVVAHSVSVMVVQAGAARRLVDGDPAKARQALTSIESTGRQALAEMRRLLGVLRRDGDDRIGEAAGNLAPQPSLADLDTLVSGAEEAGLEVELQVEGAPRPLAAGIDLSAYRIVQEALTNCIKHAGAAKATVRLCYGREDLELQVLDNGRGVVGWRDSGRENGGHGLIGMRERVAVFGGSLDVGPRPGGGFRVDARLPLEPAGL
jgi:signal transduction histidine kinase